jgi:hypothetical protein
MAATIIKVIVWLAALWAGTLGLFAAQCAWAYQMDPQHEAATLCWVSSYTGLPCDVSTFILLMLLAFSGMWTLLLLGIWRLSRSM